MKEPPPNCLPLFSHTTPHHTTPHQGCHNRSEQANVTTTGKGSHCVPWTLPPSARGLTEVFPELRGSSECHNPGRLRRQPWCFTSSDGAWDFCNVSDSCAGVLCVCVRVCVCVRACAVCVIFNNPSLPRYTNTPNNCPAFEQLSKLRPPHEHHRRVNFHRHRHPPGGHFHRDNHHCLVPAEILSEEQEGVRSSQRHKPPLHLQPRHPSLTGQHHRVLQEDSQV